MDYKNKKYDDWGYEQHKGFFRDLQMKLKDGEGKKSKEFGTLLYFDLFEKTIINNITIYFRLQHNTNKVVVRAGFDSPKEKKSQRPVLIQKIQDELNGKNIGFKKQTRPGRSLYTSLGTITDPVIQLDVNGLLDMASTIKKLENYKVILDSL